MISRSLTIVVLALVWGVDPAVTQACTTAVISGRVTANGRPLLWKNRDTSTNRHNEVAHFDEGPIGFVAVVNADERSMVWMGVNDAGFAIENSLSNDLTKGRQSSGPGNGTLMKRALATCRTVGDFKQLLAQTDSDGRQTRANYGVIDAEGGAAIFEAGPFENVVFDANDPKVAPDGYLVRSNFSTTARNLPGSPTADLPADLYSGERYCRAKVILDGQRNITAPFLLRNLCRDLADPTGAPYLGSVNHPDGELPAELNTDKTISRTTTVSAVVIEGVRAEEDPRSTTMWTMLGDPKFSIAVPCWSSVQDVADPMIEPTGAEIGEVALLLREWCLDGREDVIDTAPLRGIWQDLLPLENRFYVDVDRLLEGYRTAGVNIDDLTRLHHSAASEAMEAMTSELNELKNDVLTQRSVSARPSLTNLFEPPTTTKTPVRIAIGDHTETPTKGAANLMAILTQEAGFDTQCIKPGELAAGALADFDVIIMPGGSGSAQSRRLGPEGCREIQSFVDAGGGYVGICAGAYLASSQYTWSLNLINARVFDRIHWARGKGEVCVKLKDQAEALFDTTEKSLAVHYAQGPLLLPDDQDDLPAYEVLATYESEVALKGAPGQAMVDTHAIIRANYGNGRVICFSPHPETPGGPNGLIVAGVRWACGKPANEKQSQSKASAGYKSD